MPLLSTRAAASSAGYGQNLGTNLTSPYTGYGYVPYMPGIESATSVGNYSPLVSPNGLAAYFIQMFGVTTGSFNYNIICYSRNSISGKLTYIGTTTIYPDNPYSGSYPQIAISRDSKNLYVSFGVSSPTLNFNRVYQYSIDPTTQELTSLSTTYVDLPLTGVAYGIAISGDNKFLYVGASNNNKIYILSRDTTSGLLTYSSTFTTIGTSKPFNLFATADNANLYASCINTGNAAYGVLQYGRNIVTGQLIPLSPESVSTAATMRELNFSPNELQLHVASSNTIYHFGRHTESGGTLSLGSTQGGTFRKIAFPDNLNVVSVNTQTNSTWILTIQSGFQATIDPNFLFFTQVNNPNFLSTGDSTYIIFASPDNLDFYAMPTYNMGANEYGYPKQAEGIIHFKLVGGYLTPIEFPAQAGSMLSFDDHNNYSLTDQYNFYCSMAAISHDNKSLYTNAYLPPTPNYSGFQYTGTQFDIDATTGTVTRPTATSYSNNRGPGGIVITADDSFYYQVDHVNTTGNSPVIRQYSRNLSNGNLTELSPSTVALPATNTTGSYAYFNNYFGRPILSPDQKNIYIPYASADYTVTYGSTSSAPGTPSVPYLIQLSRDTGTGLLTYMGTINLGSYSQALQYNTTKIGYQAAIHPNGNFVFCTTQTSATEFGVCIFSRDSVTGTLSLVSIFDTTPYVSAQNVVEMCMSPDGKNLYVNGGGRIVILQVDELTGNLTHNKTAIYPTLQYYTRLVMSPTGSGIITFLFDPTNYDTQIASIGCIAIRRNSDGDLGVKYAKIDNFKAPITTAIHWFNAAVISHDGARLYICGKFVGVGYLNL